MIFVLKPLPLESSSHNWLRAIVNFTTSSFSSEKPIFSQDSKLVLTFDLVHVSRFHLICSTTLIADRRIRWLYPSALHLRIRCTPLKATRAAHLVRSQRVLSAMLTLLHQWFAWSRPLHQASLINTHASEMCKGNNVSEEYTVLSSPVQTRISLEQPEKHWRLLR